MALEGIQILKISEDHTFEFDEKALQEILLQDDVKDCSVVVVSIAGTFRGGKSFLLDFFLRYLYFKANVEGGEANEWLGDENEPLKGFRWRGGSTRDTTGIVIWSEPIHIFLPSGEKVVVLLMDTQGTFDSTSTLRQSSTIFALSTLLSSVQVYNIAQNIREYNLQHLQLFTEYGKLVSSDGDRPFQKLLFLVRDWSCPYEFAYGSTGGNQLLQNILEIKAEQPQELQEIRQHIYSSFESVNCFLMPHLGLSAVLNPRFNGCLAEISDEFKTSLQELVPSILAQENLTVKVINGRPVKAQDFVKYFKTYVNEFISDHLPSPLTIVQATAKVSLLSAIDEARRQYCSKMAAASASQAPHIPPQVLRREHEDAISAARILLDSAPALKFVTEDDKDAQIKELIEELSRSFSHYTILNDEKKVSNTTRSKEVYEESILTVAKLTNISDLCLHPEDLKKALSSAKEAALSEFDSNRIAPEEVEDDDRIELLIDFEAREDQLRNLNKTNSLSAVFKAYKFYCTCIKDYCGAQPCMNRRELELGHDQAMIGAINNFKAKRNFHSEFPVDIYKSHLLKDMEEHYNRLQTTNDENNKDAVRAAVELYNNKTRQLCRNSICVHPDYLQQRHDATLKEALAVFRDSRTGHSVLIGTGDQAAMTDNYLQDLKLTLDCRYSYLRNKNNENNESAMFAAHEEYRKGMKSVHKKIFKTNNFTINEAHTKAYEAAQLFFWERRSGPRLDNDKYLDLLEKEILASFAAIHEANNNKPEAADAAAGAASAIAGVAGVAFGLFRLLR